MPQAAVETRQTDSLGGSSEAILEKLRGDYTLYAEQCLKIKPKKGLITPFAFNRAQLYIHHMLEEQKRRTGKVRALILKGRQQGVSTYVGGRFYHQASLTYGVGVYILTHEQGATDNLFKMVERFHTHTPLRPSTGKSNAKELVFNKLDSGYSVGTAGSRDTGRSRTTQLFHGSEVAFWKSDIDHFSGVVETIPDMEDTEIILESTANGIGNEFHRRWKEAEQGKSDYLPIFVPWFWSDEYRRPVPNDFRLITTKEEDDLLTEAEYSKMYNLDPGQVMWMRTKKIHLGPIKFMQEYPSNASEAFQVTGQESFIKPADVLRARKFTIPISDASGALVIGIDPARKGKSRFSISWRRGRKYMKYETKQNIETIEAANWIKKIIDEDNPTKAFMDAGYTGAAIWDVLCSYGEKYEKVCELVDFGGSPQDDEIILENGEKAPGCKNRRAEMWLRSRDWLKSVGGVDIPDEDEVQSDACGPCEKAHTGQKLLLESKEQMRARRVESPDVWDSFVLTFASAVREVKPQESSLSLSRFFPNRGGITSWMGM